MGGSTHLCVKSNCFIGVGTAEHSAGLTRGFTHHRKERRCSSFDLHSVPGGGANSTIKPRSQKEEEEGEAMAYAMYLCYLYGTTWPFLTQYLAFSSRSGKSRHGPKEELRLGVLPGDRLRGRSLLAVLGQTDETRIRRHDQYAETSTHQTSQRISWNQGSRSRKPIERPPSGCDDGRAAVLFRYRCSPPTPHVTSRRYCFGCCCLFWKGSAEVESCSIIYVVLVSHLKRK